MAILWDTVLEYDSESLNELFQILGLDEDEYNSLNVLEKRELLSYHLYRLAGLESYHGMHALQMTSLYESAQLLKIKDIDFDNDPVNEIIDKIYDQLTVLIRDKLNKMSTKEKREFAESIGKYVEESGQYLAGNKSKILYEIQEGHHDDFQFLVQSSIGMRILGFAAPRIVGGALGGALLALGPVALLPMIPIYYIGGKIFLKRFRKIRLGAVTLSIIVKSKYFQELELQNRYISYLNKLENEVDQYLKSMDSFSKLIENLDKPVSQVSSYQWYDQAIGLLPEKGRK